MGDKVIVLVRHGKPEPRGAVANDFARKLTPSGRDALMRAYPRYFVDMPDDTVIWTSEATRTRETAELICEVAGLPVSRIAVSHALSVHDASTLTSELAACDKSVIAVGHEESVCDVAQNLTGRMRIMLPGEALCVDATKRMGRMPILWHCRPR